MILDLRIASCDNDAAMAKKKWSEISIQSQREMIGKVPRRVRKSEMINCWKRLKWIELRNFWYKNSARMKRKLNRIKNSRYKEISDDIKGVLVSDELLEREYGGNPVIKPRVYGGIQVTPAIEAFLQLPAKMRVFGKVSNLEEEAEMEVLSIKQR